MFQKLVTLGLGEGDICSSQQKGLAKVMLCFLSTVALAGFSAPPAVAPLPNPSATAQFNPMGCMGP